MRLNPGERALLASFHYFPQAEACKRALTQAGISTVQLDRIGEHGYNPEPTYSRPVLGEETSQTVAFFDNSGQVTGPSARVMTAAMPEVSGMAGAITAQGHGVLLTAVVSEDQAALAERIIHEHGGRI